MNILSWVNYVVWYNHQVCVAKSWIMGWKKEVDFCVSKQRLDAKAKGQKYHHTLGIYQDLSQVAKKK